MAKTAKSCSHLKINLFFALYLRSCMIYIYLCIYIYIIGNQKLGPKVKLLVKLKPLLFWFSGDTRKERKKIVGAVQLWAKQGKQRIQEEDEVHIFRGGILKRLALYRYNISSFNKAISPQ